MKVALVMVAVADLSGSGGAERLFSDIHQFFATDDGPVTTTFLISRSSLARLRRAGRVADRRRVVALRLGPRPAAGVTGVAWMTVRLLWRTLGRRFDVVHICLPTPSYLPYAAILSRLPPGWRPKVTLTVIDCTVAHSFEEAPGTGTYERQVLDAHRQYFRWTRLDGVFSWYRSIVELMDRKGLTHNRPVVRAARFCFTDPQKFRPASAKKNIIVFAGRLSEQKRPLVFVDAVAQARNRAPQLLASWRFMMYGKGTLEREVLARIESHRLGDIVTLTHAPDLSPAFAESRLFVSTQAFENFTSLSMLEAMAAGNAVIAQRVGQTGEFVLSGENGLLVDDASPHDFADAIVTYLSHPEWHDRMAACSRRLATEVHSVEHFAADIAAFWAEVAAARDHG
jgi:glycosyltransferase involved in cell wall biosynthesis